MKRLGKKGKAWASARAKLKKQFFNNQITRCEKCGSDFGLSFAHSKKRRHIVGDELFEVALLCIKCHEQIERLSHSEMFEEITRIIETREQRI